MLDDIAAMEASGFGGGGGPPRRDDRRDEDRANMRDIRAIHGDIQIIRSYVYHPTLTLVNLAVAVQALQDAWNRELAERAQAQDDADDAERVAALIRAKAEGRAIAEAEAAVERAKDAEKVLADAELLRLGRERIAQDHARRRMRRATQLRSGAIAVVAATGAALINRIDQGITPANTVLATLCAVSIIVGVVIGFID